MKRFDWLVVFRIIGFAAVIAIAIWIFTSNGSKRDKKTDKYLMDLATVSEELASLKEYCSDAVKYEGYEDLCISMYHVEEKCGELRELIDGAYNYFTPKDIDIDNGRSSF